MGTPASLHNITLRWGGWLASGRAHTLYINNNNRNLSRSSVANQLLLQGDAWAGGGGESLLACQRGTKNNTHRGNFILHLYELATNLRQHLGHAFGYFCGGGNRVTTKETDTSSQCTLGTGFITLHQSSFTHFATFLSTKIA